MRHYNPLLIINRTEKWGKNIQAAAYNDAPTVLEYSCKFENFQNYLLAYGSQCDLPS